MGFQYLTLPVEGEKEQLVFHDIPFEVARSDQRVSAMRYYEPILIDQQVERMFFLGMTTQAETGTSGWGGERYYAYQSKLYIGDILGRIDILYERNQMDAIPLVFGVNVWNYDTFFGHQSHEGPAMLSAPYREPLDSDEQARNYFERSLILSETDGEKYTKYIFCFKPRKKTIKHLTLRPYGGRDAGVGISAITCYTSEGSAPLKEEPFRPTDISFYVKRVYLGAMEKFARRLYQFLDDIPDSVTIVPPAGYIGPNIILKGSPEADILTNVYYHNIYDMSVNKLEEDGRTQTSTKDAPCYGFYAGIGTFRNKDHYNYHGQIWSRDIGRMLCELIEHGETIKCRLAAELLIKYLYDKSLIYSHPNWKRVVNSSELGLFPEAHDQITFQEFARGKENDGHGSIMMMIYRLYQHGIVDETWLRDNRQHLIIAAEWFCWQMDNPAESDFQDVLSSESESSYGDFGGYDLFSNFYAFYGLVAFTIIAKQLGETELEARWTHYTQRLWAGIERVFLGRHDRYGLVWCEPESDNWPSELKRIVNLLLMPEIFSYDPESEFPEQMELWRNTYKAQKDAFFSPMVGGSMGYGQGYTTQVALLLDEVEDYTNCLKWVARFSYHHTDYSFIVPEGVTYHPSGRFWCRHTDLGNAVQQTEIIKCIRLVFGLDDLNPENGLKLVPRIPDDWNHVALQDYPVVATVDGEVTRCRMNMQYSRTEDGNGFKLVLQADHPIKIASVRIGPFPQGTAAVEVHGIDVVPVLQNRGSRCFAYLAINQYVQQVSASVTVSN